MNDNQVEIEVKNRFKALMEQTESDADLKKEVFSTISAMESIAAIIDLFTVKFAATEARFFSNILPENDVNEDEV